MECDDCKALIKLLTEEDIDFNNKVLDEEIPDILTGNFPNKWEHHDLIRDYNLPPWVPKVMIKTDNDVKFVCTSTKTEQNGNIYICENNEIMVEKIKELIK